MGYVWGNVSAISDTGTLFFAATFSFSSLSLEDGSITDEGPNNYTFNGNFPVPLVAEDEIDLGFFTNEGDPNAFGISVIGQTDGAGADLTVHWKVNYNYMIVDMAG